SDATIDYLTAMKEEYPYRVILNSWQMMKDLADADSVRLSLGSIKYIDAAQSRIESGVLYNEVLNRDAERKASAVNLSSRMGLTASDTVFNLTGKFENYFREYNIDSLINTAMTSRADLRVARDNISWYRNFLELTKSERATDFDLRIGTGQDYAAKSIRDPAAHSFYAGVSVPLKFSNLNKGEVKIARYQVAQSEIQFKQAELQVRNEVMQAYTRYATLCRQVENYEKGLLEKSGEVLKGKVYSYSRGETSLLEVLNAQRTYNDLQTAYLETVYSCFVALTQLEKAAGTCNIDL
ncbi:MAG TPA: TolC family protein, partial [Bacteroidales bacterium]|nr:TolC family protein [Bacteroidales bacterium]